MSNVVPFPSPARPSYRRPRRADVMTYRVGVALEGTAEPLWRTLELASDMFLDDVHAVIQVAMGWTDSHLHRFASGPAYYSRESEFYLMPFEIDEGEQGEPEHTVRLDEVLVEPGDVLFYCYDFGDDWQHVIRLEEVTSRSGSAPRAVCIGGEGPSPAEDCGGVHGYDLLVAANDPAHPRYAESRAEYAEIFGAEVDPAWSAPTPSDEDVVNRAIGRLALDAPAVSELPARLVQLHEAIRFMPAQRALRQLLSDAGLDEPTEIAPDDAARMVARYTWLLNRVGDDGIALTSAGYLPPVHVKAAVT
ncbi:MAG: plasmid pRiA4b ORF-3 family protein, partial [Actinophytocola sp.]|nr:plasmid pRiA4b ORF-3 family protein [Actinophytocola sp.]